VFAHCECAWRRAARDNGREKSEVSKLFANANLSEGSTQKSLGGTGFFEVQFRGGNAVGVFVTMSTGHKVLDDAALTALRQWHSWKDIVRVMMVPITFSVGAEKKSVSKQH